MAPCDGAGPAPPSLPLAQNQQEDHALARVAGGRTEAIHGKARAHVEVPALPPETPPRHGLPHVPRPQARPPRLHLCVLLPPGAEAHGARGPDPRPSHRRGGGSVPERPLRLLGEGHWEVEVPHGEGLTGRGVGGKVPAVPAHDRVEGRAQAGRLAEDLPVLAVPPGRELHDPTFLPARPAPGVLKVHRAHRPFPHAQVGAVVPLLAAS